MGKQFRETLECFGRASNLMNWMKMDRVFGCWKCMNWNINIKDIKRSLISLKAIKHAIIGQLNFYLNNSLWKTERKNRENVFEKKN